MIAAQSQAGPRNGGGGGGGAAAAQPPASASPDPGGRISLTFDAGTLLVEGAGGVAIPHARAEERAAGQPPSRAGGTGVLRAHAMHYAEIASYLSDSGIPFADRARDYLPAEPLELRGLRLRAYQQRAFANWKAASMRGCVVMPTGAGKTAVAVRAIQEAGAPALVVVPTIDLMDQWAGVLARHLRAGSARGATPEIGRLGGGGDSLSALTVATYDSAYARAASVGSRFGLVVFDEVHHLPARGYRTIAECLVAPRRLGLTATLERDDGLHELVPRLVGGVVFRVGPAALSGQGHLAPYDVERRRVRLAAGEQAEYDEAQGRFLSGMRRLGLTTPSAHTLRRLIMMSNRNRAAREALLARNRAAEIAMNSAAKLDELRSILEEHAGVRTIVFTHNNRMVRAVSSRFLVPSITHRTPKDERRDVLGGFRTGRYPVIATSRVLDEGVDVPDAQLGVILSGTGSGRELIQRLGRLLRPKAGGGRARIVEVVSDQTRETGTSAKRMGALARSNRKDGGAVAAPAAADAAAPAAPAAGGRRGK